MQPHTVGQAGIDEWGGLVESAPGLRRHALRQGQNRSLGAERHIAGLQAGAAINPDPVAAIDQDIGDARAVQQGLQDAGTHEFGTDLGHDSTCCRGLENHP